MRRWSINIDMKRLNLGLGLLIIILGCNSQTKKENVSIEPDVAGIDVSEPHRPQFHFSPDSAWMNDPNGMVFHDGVYHLFYQYYPDSTVWGPMHWGHAVSSDLVNWEHKPIALYPDGENYIFSGSAVVDKDNTSGLGTPENPPLVAIFTIHDMEAERAGEVIDETQGIAFSLDGGESWAKYEGNPVLENPGIGDFRDPKVSWHQASSRWVMALAVKDHIRFYGSQNLIDWELLSEFGKDVGAHGGVWECPDLFELPVENSDETRWVLFVSINPGGPNKGSATQYFVGDFDGTTFTPDNVDVKWIDFGPDDYAGVTWANTSEKIFLGWMGNWNYAQVVPTERWRSAMTIPRSLALEKVGEDYFIKSLPHKNLSILNTNPVSVAESHAALPNGLGRIEISGIERADFQIVLSNESNEKVIVAFNKENNQFYIDRSASGETGFHTEFKDIATAPRISTQENIDLILYLDHASVEVFADGGLTTMTAIFFPTEILKTVQFDLKGSPEIIVSELQRATIR